MTAGICTKKCKNCGENGFKTHLEAINSGVTALKLLRIRRCGQNIKSMIKKFKTDDELMVFFPFAEENK